VRSARLHTEAAVETLVECLSSPSDRTKVAAAEALLNRGWGAPKQDIDLNHHLPVAGSSDADLLAIIAAGRGGATAPESDPDEPGGMVH
jgi:HEAT repeat protein